MKSEGSVYVMGLIIIWEIKFGGMSKKSHKDKKQTNNLHKYFNKNSSS
jgi:hypothetical protein